MWTWKEKNNAGGRLLYEPGNWGDILKAAWVTRAIQWLAETNGAARIRYVDTFAGAADYPASPRVKQRLALASLPDVRMFASDFLERGRWPSAARLAALALPNGAVAVFDADAERRETFRDAGIFRMLDAECGWDAARDAAPDGTGLILLDPYDFLAEWRERLPFVLRLAERTNVLVYVYNRAARSREAFRDYRDFRNALDDARGGLRKVLGRAAADGFLPTAHHEMLFLPCPRVAESSAFEALREALADGAFRTAEGVTRAGAVDD